MSLPAVYHLERDPDVPVLRADGGRLVAAFGVPGEAAVREAAWEGRPRAPLGPTGGVLGGPLGRCGRRPLRRVRRGTGEIQTA